MDDLIEKLKKRYNVHSLIIIRTLERVNGDVSKAFELLEALPEKPIMWDEDQLKWISVKSPCGEL